MEMLAAVAIGYLIGSIPTAEWIGRLWNVELRKQGSGNPGTANALGVGGPALAATVLLVEMAKGAGAALLGSVFAGEQGIVAAGLAAALGNLYNVWYRFAGGKGLGITAGVLLVAWPWMLAAGLAVIGLSAWATRSSGGATIITIVFLALASVFWGPLGLPEGWGIESGLLPFLAIGLGLAILPKHIEGARFRRPAAGES
ncbi:MAG TPA: glycerol-3-phosphate acyltransferase [Acidimicrobiia bacterium]